MQILVSSGNGIKHKMYGLEISIVWNSKCCAMFQKEASFKKKNK